MPLAMQSYGVVSVDPIAVGGRIVTPSFSMLYDSEAGLSFDLKW
jgi:hypothetical protein